MRAGLVRNVRSGEHLTTFVVSGVATVLITRLILSLSGYPQIGGKGLHIAHVLPGGLLMLIAISLLLAYVGPVVRPAAATRRRGRVRAVHRRGGQVRHLGQQLLLPADRGDRVRRLRADRARVPVPHQPAADRPAGAAGERDRPRRRRSRGRAVPAAPRRGVGAAAAWSIPADRGAAGDLARCWPPCPPDEVELAAPVDAAWQALQRGFERLATHPKAPRDRCRSTGGPGVRCAVIAAGIRSRRGLSTDLPVLGVAAGSLLSATFTVRGAVCAFRQRNRARAVRLFELAVLVSLLVTQVFQFAGTQFAAVGGMLLDLVLLGLLRSRARPDAARAGRDATKAKTLGAATRS